MRQLENAKLNDRKTASRTWRRIALGLFVFALNIGCTQTNQRAVEMPARQASKVEKLEDEDRFDIERRHVAPPPAYGNKVVTTSPVEQAPEG